MNTTAMRDWLRPSLRVFIYFYSSFLLVDPLGNSDLRTIDLFMEDYNNDRKPNIYSFWPSQLLLEPFIQMVYICYSASLLFRKQFYK